MMRPPIHFTQQSFLIPSKVVGFLFERDADRKMSELHAQVGDLNLR
jgi:hypothetical protein